MMHRSRWRRVFAAVFAPWFAVVLAEPAALHMCAMHSGHGVTAATAAATALAAAPHDGAMARMHGASPSGGAPTAPHGKTCTCLGSCCAASPVAALASAELPAVAASVRRAVAVEMSQDVHVAAAEHVLPFANGPPARI